MIPDEILGSRSDDEAAPQKTELLPSPFGEAGSELYFTTNPGLEDVVVHEFTDRVTDAGLDPSRIQSQRRPFKLAGHVLVRTDADAPALDAIATGMRSIHHVLRPVHGFPLEADPLRQIPAELAQLEIAEMPAAASFRVTTRRIGRHEFTSMDVQRVAGAALVERYARPVDLENYELNVRVDVFDRFCLVSVQLTRTSLSRRSARSYRPRAALKTTVAYAMLRLAGAQEGGGALLDPFCGSGTILTEAAALNPELELHGSDLYDQPLDGVGANLEELGLTQRIRIRRADARTLSDSYARGSFRAIVTNPPYGVILGQYLDFERFYYRFLVAAGLVLEPGGMLVMLAWKHGDLIRALRAHGGFSQRHVRVVETGELYPRIFVLQRKAS
jgi:tRNA (guanine6-N2)-methyltransferase